MRKPSPLTAMLLLLVLAPSGMLAWLGLRSADAFDASELSRLRGEVASEADRLRARGRTLRDAVDAEIQSAVDHHAQQTVIDLPGLSPAGVGRRLRRTRSRISSRGLQVVDLRLLDADGRTFFPVPHVADDERPRPAHATRSGLLAHLRREADRAFYGSGDPHGEEAAVAVWSEAARHTERAPLLLLFDVETARIRARRGSRTALRETERLDEAWPASALVDAGRSALLLWLAAVAIPVDADGSLGTDATEHTCTDRLRRLVEDGTVDATPLTAEERRRIRSHIRRSRPEVDGGDGLPDPGLRSLAFFSALPAGARMAVRISRASLYKQLMLQLVPPGGGLGPGTGVWIEGYQDRMVGFESLQEQGPLAGRERAFREAARTVVSLPLPGGDLARVHLRLRRWHEAYAISRDRRSWTIVGISLLLLATVFGLVLVRRAVSREREARRVRDDFIANVTHEVRTPLTSVLLHAEMLTEEDTPPAKRREHAEVVQTQGRRLAALVGDMLDFAALQRGTRTLESQPVNLTAACREALAPYWVRAEREGVSLRLDPAEGEVTAMADPAALARILANLVGNAWKHGRPSRDGHPGRLRVVAREDAAGGRIDVRDDGPGIAREERRRVFERFGRGGAAVHTEGSGIGLALARDLARGMDGDVAILEDGQETVFRLTLPPVPDLDLA